LKRGRAFTWNSEQALPNHTVLGFNLAPDLFNRNILTTGNGIPQCLASGLLARKQRALARKIKISLGAAACGHLTQMSNVGDTHCFEIVPSGRPPLKDAIVQELKEASIAKVNVSGTFRDGRHS